jgi:lipoprotein-anchoring transpeptidase ErfK/SrfK/transposase-like protein
MVFCTAGAIATLVIGLGGAGGQALAQYYPPPQTYPPQAYPPWQPLPPMADADEDAPPLNTPVLQGPPLPPVGVGPQANEPPAGTRYGRGTPAYPADAAQPPSDGGHGYRSVQPPQGYEPAAAGTHPYYGVPGAIPPGPAGSAKQDAIRQEAMRSRLPISPGQIGPGPVDSPVTGSTQSGDPRNMAAFPPEVRPETGPKKELPSQFRRTLVDYRTKEPAGTIIVDTPNTYLYLVLGDGKALRYGVGVGREGFTWSGAERVTKMAEWPDWNPPEEMIVRQPYLPRFMAGGETNPLGARALYLGKTAYRIHGTNQPSTIGTFVSSGCIRLTNEDIMDLYKRVKVGTRVVVLPSRPSMTAATATVGSPRGMSEVTPYGLPSASDMPRKRYKPEEITAKLQQVDVLVAQGQSIADASRQVGITESRYYRWRQERAALKRDEVKKPAHETPKGSTQGEVSAVRDNDRQMEFKVESAGFEE